jgi:hypothetical protein
MDEYRSVKGFEEVEEEAAIIGVRADLRGRRGGIFRLEKDISGDEP